MLEAEEGLMFLVPEDGERGVPLGFEGSYFAGEGGMNEAEIDVTAGRGEGGRRGEGSPHTV